MTSTKALPLVLGSMLGIMLAILCLVLYLFYKKRKESLEFKIPLEKMTRGLKSMSMKRSPKSTSGSRSSNDSISKQQQQGVRFFILVIVYFYLFNCLFNLFKLNLNHLVLWLHLAIFVPKFLNWEFNRWYLLFQTPVLRDTQFWVPEVYNSIVQPSPTPLRKSSRLQSTLDREIYSKAHDTSYLQAAEPEVSP